MSDNVIVMTPRRSLSDQALALRLRRMASMLTAIDAGELLAALPDCPLAQQDHTVALDLLGALADEIDALLRTLSTPEAPFVPADEHRSAPMV